MKKSKKIRWRIIRSPWIFPIAAYNLAAIEIQRRFRGMRERKRLNDIARGVKKINRGPRNPQGRPVARGKKKEGSMTSKYLASVRTSQMMARSGSFGVSSIDGGLPTWCCIRIQAWWRMLMVQRYFKYHQFYIYSVAALQIQVAWRKFCQSRYFESATTQRVKRIFSPDVATVIIQRCWRQYTSYKIFKYYRDLINFRLVGDPAVLLKTISPQESSFFDAAMGIHVRFRLGRGYNSDFPPVLYYKIYTHNPLCDVNAFAPRDYTHYRPPSPGSIHCNDAKDMGNMEGSIRVGRKLFNTTIAEGKSAEQGDAFQYRRVENNPWRPISVKTLQDMDKTPEELRKEERSQPFHFSRLKRQQDLSHRRKEMKRQWLIKMYRDGLAQEAGAKKSGGASKQVQPSELRRKSSKQIDFEGKDWEEEADELLQWSEELDYDNYVHNWLAIGTSGSSNPKMNHLYQESLRKEAAGSTNEAMYDDDERFLSNFSKALERPSMPFEH